MAPTRREPKSAWPELWDRAPFEWPPSSVEAWRRLLEEDEMSVEEFIENDEIVVRAELPGVDPDRDVDIEIVDGNLRIRAERRQEETVEERDYRRSEIRYGSFSRTLPLPVDADEDDIDASYKDGILEVRAPVKDESSKPSRVPISRA